LLSQRENVGVLDTKEDLDWPGFWITSDLDEAFKHTHFIFRPQNGMQIYGFFERGYQEGGWTLYVDEIYQIGRGSIHSFPKYYVRGLTAGRSKGVTIVTGTQRPKFLPLFAITESTHIFCMELNSRRDRVDLARLTGADALERNVGRHQFIYYNTVSGKAVLGIIKL